MRRFNCEPVFIFMLCAIGAVQGGFSGEADFILTLGSSVRSTSAFSELCDAYNLTAKYVSLDHGVAAVRIPDGISAHAAALLFESDPRIAGAEPDAVMQAALRIPGDPFFPQQWALYNPLNNRADVKAPEAWEMSRGARRVIVAIIDSGIDYFHPELAKNIWNNNREIPDNNRDDDNNGYVDDIHGWDFAYNSPQPIDRHFHGTLMSGIIGAEADNGTGIAGIMHDVSLMAVKGLGDGGFGFTSDLIAGIYYAVDNGADVINASWGGAGYSQALSDAIAYAGRKNVLFIAAAGNAQKDNDRDPFYPASYDLENIISVAASDIKDRLADFSHYGRISVDIAAPGVGVISTAPGNQYMTTSGTSMSAPHVAACIGLLIAHAPGLAAREYKAIVLKSADQKENLKGMCSSNGRLDIAAALSQSLLRRNDVRYALYYLSRYAHQ